MAKTEGEELLEQAKSQDSKMNYLLDLAMRLQTHADVLDRIGKEHPAYAYPLAIKDMRDAADQLIGLS